MRRTFCSRPMVFTLQLAGLPAEVAWAGRAQLFGAAVQVGMRLMGTAQSLSGATLAVAMSQGVLVAVTR